MSQTKMNLGRAMDSAQLSELKGFADKALAFAQQLLGQRADAEDVVQLSLVKVLSHPSAPKGGVDLQKWLYRIVRNSAIDKLREQKRWRSSSDDDDSATMAIDECYEPDKRLEQEQLKSSLHKGLASLSPAHREVLMLRDYHGCSYQEIAEIVSISEGTVMSRLHRARLALREYVLKS